MIPPELMGMIIIVVLLICTLFYMSTKGMCRWTEHDHFIVFFIKHIINVLLGGIPGLVMFAVKNKDCKLSA